jgi:hypothetical protein
MEPIERQPHANFTSEKSHLMVGIACVAESAIGAGLKSRSLGIPMKIYRDNLAQ